MYNKKQFNKVNNKKLLHKVKKQWVTISLALFMMIGGGAIATHVSASANDQSMQPNVTQSQTKSNSSQAINQQAKTLHTSLMQAANQKSMRLGASYHGRPLVKSHYRRTNQSRQLRQSGYGKIDIRWHGLHGFAIYNRYAPNSYRARVPRRFRPVNGLTWGVGSRRTLLLYPEVPDRYIYRSNKHAWVFYRGIHRSGHKRARRNYRRYRKPARRRNRLATSKNISSSRVYRVYTPIRRAHYRRHNARKPRRTRRYSGLYVNSDSGSDMFISNSDLNDMSNINKNSDGDFSDDFVQTSESKPLKVNVINAMNFDGYKLNQINHHVSGHAGNLWVFPNELSHNPNRYVNPNYDFDNLIEAAVKHNQRATQQVNKQAFNNEFTSDEKTQINQIKQQYNYLNRHENSSKGIYVEKPDLADGVPGQLTSDYKQSVTDWVNFYRGLYGLSPVTDSPSYDQMAQYGADGCNAIGQIEHGLGGTSAKPSDINSDDWQRGMSATMHSNLYQESNPNDMISGYFYDPGQSDNIPGHRSWMLDQGLHQIGIGEDNGFNDLYVVTPSDNGEANQQTLVYPNAGVFPVNDVKGSDSIWSLFLPDTAQVNNDDLSISVHDDTANVDVPVLTSNAETYSYGYYSTINYKVEPDLVKANHQYTITITGAGVPNGEIQYSTKLFNL